jgi:putative SOS response-associated peptidase YedK
MCGRFSLTADVETIAVRFSLHSHIPSLQRRYNIAPGAPILGIASNEGQRKADLFQWGLIPPYEQNKPSPKRLVNVRIETLLERPTFLPLRQRRVLVPADAFFEWKKDGNRKLPYKIGLKENALFGLAAVSWPFLDKNQRPTLSLAILATEANGLVAQLHTRMPIILPFVEEDAWLGPELFPEALYERLRRPFPKDALIAYPVSLRLNTPYSESPGLLQPIGEPLPHA